MSYHVVEGRPVGRPEFEPLRLTIDPGDASAEEMAELLAAFSGVSMAFGAGQIEWTMVCPCCCPEPTP